MSLISNIFSIFASRNAERVMKLKLLTREALIVSDCKTKVEQFSVKQKLKYLHKKEKSSAINHVFVDKSV